MTSPLPLNSYPKNPYSELNSIERYTYHWEPALDIIVAVPDIWAFHKENILLNKSHYTYLARLRKGYLTSFFQSFGGGIHYNYYTDECNNLIKYGVIQTSRLKKDLMLWESLLVSSYMHKPFTVLKESKEINECQKGNLKSAVALSCLLTNNNCKLRTFFYNIAIIPKFFRQNSTWFSKATRLINTDNYREITKENIDKFKEIYNPVIEEHFKDIISIENDCVKVCVIGRLKKINDSFCI